MVDLEVGVIRVERNLDDAEGEQETKTDAGRRTVPIGGALRRVLAEHLMASGRPGDDLLVGVTATRPFQPTTLRRRALKAWGWRQDRDKLVPSGTVNPPLAPLTPHEGRHVAASFLLAAGVPLFEVSRYVGHTDVRTTANVNGHLVEGQEQEAARRLDELLERPAARQLRDS
jgi:integrase